MRPSEDPRDDALAALARIEADLQLQAAGHAARERDVEVAARTRAERGALDLVARWRAAADETARSAQGALSTAGRVDVEVAGRGTLSGVVVEVGADHVALRTPSGPAWVALEAVLGVAGLPVHAGAAPGTVAARRSLRGVLRDLAESAARVRLHRRDGVLVVGRVVLVAADHVDLVTTTDPATRGAPDRRLSVPLPVVACLEAAGARGPGPA